LRDDFNFVDTDLVGQLLRHHRSVLHFSFEDIALFELCRRWPQVVLVLTTLWYYHMVQLSANRVCMTALFLVLTNLCNTVIVLLTIVAMRLEYTYRSLVTRLPA
jgi:small-conductance mechanosensitive channel